MELQSKMKAADAAADARQWKCASGAAAPSRAVNRRWAFTEEEPGFIQDERDNEAKMS